MKNIMLAVDCSMRVTGVAVSEGGRTVAYESLDLGRRQSAELPLMAERLNAKAGLSWDDIDFVAVTNGPGYFTGIRVGVSWAASLAYGLGVPIIPVSSLEMLAYSFAPEHEKPVLSMIYAGRNSVYAASFGIGGKPEDDLALGEYSGAEISAWINDNNRGDIYAISDDAERAAASLGVELPLSTPITEVRPNVTRLAELAWAKKDRAVSPMELRVAYCRAPV